MDQRQLIKMLKEAHAGETAAMIAYGGHWRSINPDEHILINDIKKIELDEKDHILVVEEMLKKLGAKRSWFRTALFWCIGKVIAFLCHVTTKKAGLKGAKVLERIGSVNYEKMADIAESIGRLDMAEELTYMAEVEKEHEEFFDKELRYL